MRLVFQYGMSLLFIGQMYLMMALSAIAFLPWAAVSSDGACAAVRFYCKWVRWSARVLVGLRSEVRGIVPQDEMIVASKHQSFFDIIMLVSVLPRPKFIMKASLKYAPFLGWYAARLGCIPVDRGKGGRAVTQMVVGVKDPANPPGQLIIYPQGTRVAPGADKAYKVGVSALYQALGQDVALAATNVGVFWPRHGVLRKPGLAVVEFLHVVPAGKPMPEFMDEIETTIETASNKLLIEAGFKT